MSFREKLTKGPIPWLLALPAALLLIISRRSDAVFNAQFWAEDGKLWYADAYNYGALHSLLTPEAGYYQTFSRLAAIFSQPLPLEYAPLFFNILAITIQAVVAAFIVSGRLGRVIPMLHWRVVLAFIYLALPHSGEIYANVTNSQWHLALLAFLVIIAGPSENRGGRVFDIVAVGISAVSGPLCLLLIPIAVSKYYRKREKWAIVLCAILAAGALLQGYGLLTTPRPTQAALGAGPTFFFRILGRHIFAGPIFGTNGFEWLDSHRLWKDGSIIIVNLFGLVLAVYAFLKARFELRLFMIFAVSIFAVALYSPAVSPVPPQWGAMANSETAIRYWFIPALCVFAVLLFLAADAKSRIIRYAAIFTLTLSLIGIVSDWRMTPREDLGFKQHARDFETAPTGAEVRIPINPAGWEMKLIKK